MADKQIEGLDTFLKVCDAIQKKLPEETKDAAQAIARDWSGAARGRASRPQAKEAAGALQIGFDAEGVRVSNSHVAFFGEEFGGRARPETMMFPPHQGQRGYWFYPAARANADKFNRMWEAAIDKATESWDRKG